MIIERVNITNLVNKNFCLPIANENFGYLNNKVRQGTS